MKRNVGLAARCLCSGALLLASLSIGAKDAPKPGAIVHLKDGNDHSQCVTVIAVDAGVDGQPWVWFSVVDDPRRAGHVPVIDLGGPC